MIIKSINFLIIIRQVYLNKISKLRTIPNKEKCKKYYTGNIRIGIPLNGAIAHLCTAGTEKLDIKYDGTVLPCPAFKELNVETMKKYGIRLHNIYEDLEKVVVHEGKRKTPLCRQVYGFKTELVNSDEEQR